ncbi:MAG: porin [Verrucomicrobia bacterium]|nr:porin [Verrucomicrobiota bacterium]
MRLATTAGIWVLGLWGLQSTVAWGNAALDFLEAELGEEELQAENVSEEDPVEASKKVVEAVEDPSLPTRWNPELVPLLSVNLAPTEGDTLALRGLYEWRLDHGEVDVFGGDGQKVDSSRARRARLGVALKTFYQTELQADVLFEGDADYAGIETLMARVPVGDSLLISGGKFPPPFTLEYTQDAAVRWTRELSPMVAQMVPASSLGLMAQGRSERWDWKLGWFSGDADRDVPSWRGDGYLLAGLGYSAYAIPPAGGDPGASAWHRWHLDYIYNADGARSRSVPMGYEHLLATGFQYSSGRVDFMNDFLMARGDASSAYGLTMTGGYWLMEDALRMVARFDYGKSNDPGGILAGWGVPAGGAEALQPFSYPVMHAGGELYSIYAGLDLFLYDQNLILSSGLEMRTLKEVIDSGDIDSLIWQTGGRIAF